ncbi:hypothetical protein [Achromobacter aloeverae]|uniref:hypothetical protein n=1 Tax=Achromobacter aloeverae TaxID=1750518 RepID=UPI00100EB486|nr:hypothetical protein [Achromobacter aloeverae]
MLFVRANSTVLGVCGSRVMVQEWVPLGDDAFSIRIPLVPGQAHAMAYGGRVLFYADGPANVRVVEQAPWSARAAGRLMMHARAVIAWIRRHSTRLSGPA